MSGGWIKLHRKLLDSAVWQLPCLDLRVWLWLLMSVNWEPRRILLLNTEVEIGVGEIITSYAHIAEGVAQGGGKGRKRIVPSASKIRTATSHLLELNCIETITEPSQGRHQPWLHIKVLNWIEYQGNDDEDVSTSLADIISTSSQPRLNLVSTIEEGKKERSKEEDISSKVPGIFAHWQAVMDKPNSKLTPDRRARIITRMREGYSAEDIMAAIDGCRASAWHMGENPRGAQYNDFDLICRNGSKLEQFMAAKDGNKTALQVLRERWSK
jgi:hypothetical protein